MIVYHDIGDFNVRKPVVTVGIFDGVHPGHRYILEKLKESADNSGGDSVVVTLWPHPRLVLEQEDNSFGMLTTMDEKIPLLRETGVGHLVILPFTKEFSRLSSCEFIEEYLVRSLGLHKLVVGYNHRFGRDREGDFDKLKRCADRFGFGMEKLEAFRPGGLEISSSKIRRAIHEGDVTEAASLLGRAYSLTGQVVGGSRLGRSMGFPTANITPEDPAKLVPSNGVYAVQGFLRGGKYRGMLNIGTRPTVNSDPDLRTIEVHLLDFSENIYRESVRIEFGKRIRDERKFTGIGELRAQLDKDREETRNYFSGQG